MLKHYLPNGEDWLNALKFFILALFAFMGITVIKMAPFILLPIVAFTAVAFASKYIRGIR